jgi:hypothetical protein
MVAAAISKAKQASALKSSRVVLVDEPTQLTPAENQLFKFDTCVDAADALTASSGQEAGGILPSQRLDGRTGLSDCSVLVSPEGDLLLIPGDPRQLFNSGDNSNAVSAKILQADTEESPTASAMSSSSPSSLFSELMLHAKDDYASSVFLGTDLAGDRALNRFSSKGWSITATSISVRQTCQAMQNAVDFCEQLAHHRKRAASRIADAFEALQLQTARLHGTTAAPMPYGDLLDPQRPENSLEPISLQGAAPAATLTPVPTRVGPLVLETCSLRDAWQGVTSYYSMAAQQELKNWNRATSKVASHPSADSLEATTSGPRRGSMSRAMGLVESLRAATASLNDRAHRRQSALEGAASRVRQMEQRLAGLKQIAAARWDAVFVAEDLVTQRVEALMQERSREREKQRMEQLRVADESTGAGLGATSEEIWSIVSTVAENMEDGSFEPLDMPEVPLTLSRDQSTDDPSPTKSVSANGSPATDGEPSPPLLDTSKVVASANASPKAVSQPPPVSREMIEMEVGLPELRAAAMAADEAVADGADAFMNMLTTLDTTRRSARIAADTAIVSACNAQAECIRQLLQLERQSLEERLKQLGEVEKLAEKIDVRSDLDRYISVDKVTRGGTSHLGDDDDGGIASALAILSRHIDGSMGSDHMHRMTGDGVSVEDDGTTSEMLMIAFDRIFQKDNPHLSRAADPSSEEVAQERYSFEDAVSLLCTNISKAGPTARARRSTICYLLNAKRSAHAEIATPIQFRALCRLFSAILTGCNAEAGGVSNAKMCIMLAQTFYVNRQGKDDGLDNSEHSTSSGKTGEASTTREHRIYVKSYLKSHPIWENDDFWCVDRASRNI